MRKRICVLVCNNVEEMEMVVPVDIFRRCGFDVVIATFEKDLDVVSANRIHFIADAKINGIDPSVFDALVVPGGPSRVADEPAAIELAKRFAQAKKLICAICAAPVLLHNAGVLEGKHYCAHPCTYDTLTAADRSARVVVDGDLITGKGPGVAAEFALAIVAHLTSQEEADRIKKQMFL